MGKVFDLLIFTAETTLYKGKVCSVIIPGESGHFGVLADHAPFIANITRGTVTIKDDTDTRRHIPVTGNGFFHMQRNRAIVLVSKD